MLEIALITPDIDFISGPLIDPRAASDTINLHILLGSPDMVIGIKLVKGILMMCTPSCTRLECPPSTDACWHHLHVVDDEPPASVLLSCDEDFSVQLDSHLLGDSPFLLVTPLFPFFWGEKPEETVKKQGGVGICERCLISHIFQLLPSNNLFDERGKIILGTSGNLGKDKTVQLYKQIEKGKNPEREPKLLNFDL